MPLLPPGPALIVSGDIWTRYDYACALHVARRMAADAAEPRVHLVMVPNPPYHPAGDFALDVAAAARDGAAPLARRLDGASDGQRMLTYGNIGVFDTALFRELPRGEKLKLLPLLLDWIDRRRASGELYDGPWENVGTPADLQRLDAALAREASQGITR
jgi:MurNAc alpha-1-phosphate uridylyltransferase